jgi:hypothetical protein
MEGRILYSPCPLKSSPLVPIPPGRKKEQEKKFSRIRLKPPAPLPITGTKRKEKFFEQRRNTAEKAQFVGSSPRFVVLNHPNPGEGKPRKE